MNKKRLTLWVLGTLAMITLFAGITWAFFSYVRTGDPNVFRTGNIYFNSEYTGAELTNVFPINKNKVDTDTENVMEVNVNIEGYTSYAQGVDYTIKAVDVSLTTGGKNVPINAKVSAENVPNIETFSFEGTNTITNNAVLAKGNIMPIDGNVDGTVTIKAYIDKANVVISDTYDGTESNQMGTTNEFVNGRQVFTTSEWNALESSNGVSFRVKVEAEEYEDKILYEEVEKNLASYLLEADGEGDYDARIIAGSKDDTNLNNYVWYSGKLWRIVALNNNGTMKLVTDNNMTTIAFGETPPVYEDSYMKEWLNTVFLDTLYEYDNFIVTDYLWDTSLITTSSVKPEATTTSSGPVGALNVYEYNRTNNFSTNSFFDSYLNIGTLWWTLSKKDENYNSWTIANMGYDVSGTVTNAYGVRPSIVLKSNIIIGNGTGSANDPYTLKGDYQTAENNELLNRRISGEYIKFNNTIYRIIDTEEINTQLLTKVTMMDYTVNKNTINTSVAFNDNSTFSDNTGIGLYLKNWYEGESISEQYKEMIATKEEGVGWYQGPSEGIGMFFDYRQSLQGEKISTTIGLPYYGEMFASHQIKGYKESVDFWLITQYQKDAIRSINSDGFAATMTPSQTSGVRPTFYLKSTVKIGDVDGDGKVGNGTINHPYELVMD